MLSDWVRSWQSSFLATGSASGQTLVMWLTALGVSLLVVTAFWVTLFFVARVVPPGRTREFVALRQLCDHDSAVAKGPSPAVTGPPRPCDGSGVLCVAHPGNPEHHPVIGQTDDILVLVGGASLHLCGHLPRPDVEAAWPGESRYLDVLLGQRVATGANKVATAVDG